MRVLITNDDGIEAPGLDVLEHIASAVSKEVWVVAPETDQSGASHSLTLAEPLRMRELGKRRYAVKGTPTDCVIMGVRFLLKDKPPDLVLSGVNRGQNLADDVNYSGTVAGAIEGVLLGVPSIALSLAIGNYETGKPIWDTPMRHGGGPARQAARGGMARGRGAQRQFSGLPARCRQRHGGDLAKASATRTCSASRTGSIPAASPITGSASSAANPSRRKAPTSGRCSPAASR